MVKVNGIALKAQEKAHKQHVEMVKSHVLDFLLASPHQSYKLSELWKQRRVSPLNEMSMEEFKSFLNEHGYEMKPVTEYLISKKRKGDDKQ